MTAKSKNAKSLTYFEALQDFQRKNFAPVYLFHGEERFFHDELLLKAREGLLEPGTEDFNFDLFYGEDANVDQVIAVARSYPMMAQRRLVILKDLQNMRFPGQLKLVKYAQNPVASTCLIISYMKRKLSVKWEKELSKSAVSVDCRSLYDNEIISWIQQYVKSRKMRIEPAAVQELYRLLGNSIMNIVNEINKIQAAIEPRTDITFDDVNKISSFSRQFTIFDLANSVAEKKMMDSLVILKNLIDQGESETTIVSQLSNHFINLLKIKDLVQRRKQQEIEKHVRVHRYFVSQLIKQASQFKLEQLRAAVNYLAEADFRLKTSFLNNKRIIVEMLMFRLING